MSNANRLPSRPPHAIILAGGLGSRLSPVVSDRQKVVATVSNRPFVSYVLNWLSVAGVRAVTVALGHLAQQAEEIVESVKPEGMDISYSKERERMGTGGAIRGCLEHVSTTDVLILNGDSIVDIRLDDFFHFHESHTAKISAVVCYVDDNARYGKVSLNSDNEIIAFTEKNSQEGLSGNINGGVYMTSTDIIESMCRHPHSFERDVLPKFVGNGLYGFRTTAAFIDIGTPDDFRSANRILKTFGNIR
jgi:D-glycero-alpha-D-manno-heptose 1-phosphate guanylyltransferase